VRRVVILAGVLLLVAIDGASLPLTILYTNDLHLRLQRLESIERLIAEERAKSDVILLLDAGDTWQDFRRLLPMVWGAHEAVEWMNRVGYDAMALGNHDMYWGAKRLRELVRQAEFPVLCANLVPVRRGAVTFLSSTELDVEGICILVIGLITEELLPYSAYPSLRPIDPAVAVRAEIARATSPADVVVVVAHLPVADAIRVALAMPEIDVFVTGHSHEEASEPVRVGDTLVVQAGAFGQKLGRLVIDVAPGGGRHRLIANELIPTDKAPTDVSRGLRQLVTVALAAAAVALLVLL
jgi:2',3'-cyclic-nucleotide 2'-phosphodiesterase (5'-nucleotidase family)